MKKRLPVLLIFVGVYLGILLEVLINDLIKEKMPFTQFLPGFVLLTLIYWAIALLAYWLISWYLKKKGERKTSN
ncbi:MAG TPA: hypothetical protein PL160_00385 [Candidatus Cloacimonas sp.]|jgi:hypothetical protein|nr:hypothetical protein [Candidatus Cloacimonas sp.]